MAKEGIHPEYPAATVGCACGSSFVTKSTRGDFTVDVCSMCHPFYTGTQKLMDAAGRVDRFRKRYAAKPGPGGAAGAAAPEAARADRAEAPAAESAEAAPSE